MASTTPPGLIPHSYDEWAQEYLRSLPLEHFMESTPQATQREITVESLALLCARRREVQVFNELLVQYPVPGQVKPGQVVPDNMVVLSDEPARDRSSYNLPEEKSAPFWVLEYVSKTNKRKDYDDNFGKYEQQLRVPYYLLFDPGEQDLTLYHHDGTEYVPTEPNRQGRYAIAELDLEVALQERWVRYWYRGQLLPLPADLERNVADLERDLQQAKRRIGELERELSRLRAAAQQPPPRDNGPEAAK
jgi:Uma2 family endonuclease